MSPRPVPTLVMVYDTLYLQVNGGSGCVVSDDDDDDDDADGGGLVVALSPSCSPSPPPGDDSPTSTLSVAAVQQVLWSARSSLHDAAAAAAASVGWDERLEPLRPTLTANVGADYRTPSDSHAATVDLVLAVLHSRLDQLARSSSQLP